MFKLINAAMVCAVLASAFVLYSQEHTTRELERAIAKAEKQTKQEREKIKLLEAEWAALTRPERIQQIAEEQLHLQVLQPQQFVPLAEVGSRLPQPKPKEVQAENKDEIGTLLEKMQ